MQLQAKQLLFSTFLLWISLATGKKGSGGHKGPRVSSGLGSFSGLGRLSGGSFQRGVTGKTTTAVLGGLLAGYVGAKVIKKIGSGSARMFFGDRDYWYGDRYYPYFDSDDDDMTTCKYVLDNFDRPQYEDGTFVDSLYYRCPDGQDCCGLDCCYYVSAWWVFVIIVIGIVILFSCCCCIGCCLWRRFRRSNPREDRGATSADIDMKNQPTSAGYSPPTNSYTSYPQPPPYSSPAPAVNPYYTQANANPPPYPAAYSSGGSNYMQYPSKV